MHWNDVIGHERLKQSLQQTIDADHISHAYLISGKEGYGGLPLALAFATQILCLESPDRANCIAKCAKIIHPDLHFVFPVNRTKKSGDVAVKDLKSNLFLEDWRAAVLNNPYMSAYDWMKALGIEKKQGNISVAQSQQIIADLALRPYESAYKVMLIWLPERMAAPASNKLLKILEEPPQKTVFLLISVHPEKLLSTILSRVHVIHLKPIQRDEIIVALKTKLQLKNSDAEHLSKISHGDYSFAMRLVQNQSDREAITESFKQWMRMLWQKDYSELLQWVEHMAAEGRENQIHFLNYGMHLFRESLIWQYGKTAKNDINRSDENEAHFLAKFHPYIHSGNVLSITGLFEKGIFNIERNANQRLVFINISLKMMKLIRLKEISAN